MLTPQQIERLDRFPRENRLIRDLYTRVHPLIVVHRGVSGATIVENTAKSFTLSLRMGADVIETDVVRSTDGEFFLFHDGYEPRHFGLERNIRELSAAEIRELDYKWATDPSKLPYGVEPLSSLTRFPDTLFNIDRSWDDWPVLLDELASFDMAENMLLKSPVGPVELGHLAAHPVKFPYLAIVRTMPEVNAVLACHEINCVGVEVLATEKSDELASEKAIQKIKDTGLLVQLNAINLENRNDLFLGWDDEASLLEGPEAGWGKLIDMDADLIQTDWPSPLRQFRGTRVGR